MPKKEGVKNLKKVILESISKVLHSKLEDFAANMKEKINHTKKVIIERIFSSIIIIIALIFLAIAFNFYLIEYRGLTKTLAFLITAGVLFLLAFIVKYHSMKK